MAKINKPTAKHGKTIHPHETNILNTDNLPVIFSLEYIQKSHCFSKCTKDEKLSLIELFFERKTMTWREIKDSGRSACGSEKIFWKSIKSSIPAHLKEDTTFLSLRFCGKKPMVGYREGRIFYILWLDRNFDLYDHGS